MSVNIGDKTEFMGMDRASSEADYSAIVQGHIKDRNLFIENVMVKKCDTTEQAEKLRLAAKEYADEFTIPMWILHSMPEYALYARKAIIRKMVRETKPRWWQPLRLVTLVRGELARKAGKSLAQGKPFAAQETWIEFRPHTGWQKIQNMQRIRGTSPLEFIKEHQHPPFDM